MNSTIQNSITPLSSILNKNNDSIKNVCRSLMLRGYAFIILPDFLVREIDNILVIINKFFNNPLKYKNQFSKEPIFGYFKVGHKESFRMLTGMRMQEHKFPNNFGRIKDFVQYIDKIMYSISLSLAPFIFPNLINKSKELDIPLYNKNKSWGMFDIAKYFNDGSKKDLNCEEHYDPGLLSFSLRSTESGLQLKDEFDNWIDAPINKNIAILWTGEAAIKINPKLKPGVHRVRSLQKIKPRIAIWHEICTSFQEHKELVNDKTKKAITYESTSGIPISKSRAPEISIKPQNNLLKNKNNIIRKIQPLGPLGLINKPICGPMRNEDWSIYNSRLIK